MRAPASDSLRQVVAHNAFARSKTFALEGQQWYMGLYPHGDDDANRGFVSIFLFQDGAPSPLCPCLPPCRSLSLTRASTVAEPTRIEGRLHVDFTIRILNRDARRSLVKALKGNFPVLGGQGWGECKFVKSDALNELNGFVKVLPAARCTPLVPSARSPAHGRLSQDDRLQIDIDLAVRSARAQI